MSEVRDEESSALMQYSKATSTGGSMELDVLSRRTPLQNTRQTLVLPAVDKALITRNVCIAGIALSYGAGLTCIALAIALHAGSLRGSTLLNPDYFDGPIWYLNLSMAPAARTVVSLLLNVAVTLCTECLGYVHATSLRWALWREGRLHYNSNLRLFTPASQSAVNSWYANGLCAVALVITYTGASQTLMIAGNLNDADQFVTVPTADVNGISLLFLGIGLLVQAIVAHWCLWKQSTRILTWSSNALSVTLACLHDGSVIRRREGRCMLSVLQGRKGSATPEAARPTASQPPLREVDGSTAHITRFIWVLIPMTLIWAIVVDVLNKHFATGYNGPRAFGLADYPYNYFYGVLVIAAFQTFATLGLHSIELLVNRSRDEFLWRRAAAHEPGTASLRPRRSTGALKSYDSTIAALTTWQSITLFVFKPFIHWLFGSGLTLESNGSPDNIGYIYGSMSAPYIFGLCAAVVLLAIFATALSRIPPKGYIPAAWGHLQTLADLIDDWGDGTVDVLYWGDKTDGEVVTRHAGTSSDKMRVKHIREDFLYSGK